MPRRRHAWVLSGALIVLATPLAPATASAHGGGSVTKPPTPSELPPGPLKRLILDLQQRLRTEKHAPTLLDQPIGEALRATDRASSARAAGDRVHGSLLDKLAEQWGAVASAVVKAVETEGKATRQAQRLDELTTKVERAEALLSEHQARLGRLQAEVKKADEDVKRPKADKPVKDAKGKKKAGEKGADAP